jgi:P4 family phage/plasmid primase-like protien
MEKNPKVKEKSSVALNNTIIRNPGKQYSDFLNSHYVSKDDNKPFTNARMPDKKNGKKGASYHIDENEYQEFLKMYAKEIIVKNISEHLTELQLENNGPILVDLDFHYDYSITSKQYQYFHIEAILDSYLEILNSFYQFDENTKFRIYVQEKDNVNRLEEKNITKDGIHIIIGIDADKQTQEDLRKKIIATVSDSCSDIPINNTWEDVFDNSITSRKSGWQLYGSRKPNHEAYKLTHIFEVSYDEEEDTCKIKKIDLNHFDIVNNIYELSARCTTHPKFIFKSEYLNNRPKSNPPSAMRSQTRRIGTARDSGLNSYVLEIKNQEQLDSLYAEFMDTLLPQEFELRESNDFVMILPDAYYGVGSFSKWIRVGWALRNISDRLLIVWIKFSSQASNWSFELGIPDLYERWQQFDLKNPNGLTKHSIMHWAKQDAPEHYKRVRATCIDYYIDQTIKSVTANTINNDKNSRGSTEVDITKVLYQMYKSEFVCVSIKHNKWYRLKNHLWVENDAGTTLRKAISGQMRDLYWNRAQWFMEQAVSLNPPDEEKSKRLQEHADKILKICDRLGRAGDKNNIMMEAKEMFYDEEFVEKLDTNEYLMAFRNGVVDFKQKCFRKGYPEDYLSLCTGNDYISIDEERDASTIAEIQDFMRKLFPVKEIHDYMWEHLAAILIGNSALNQTFNMYIGDGRNGKSALMELMKVCLGQYKGDVPLPLITDRRTKIGGLAPELVELKGVRLAVINEPDPESKLNVGMMKQLTSGLDPIQARAPYMTKMVTFLPQFKLVLCSNEFMVIPSQDHGTWRRIRVVDFMSLFTENPVQGDREKPYQYEVDLTLPSKFPRWKHVFTAMLVDIAFRTNGIVRDCPHVLSSSESYKNSTDYVGDFIREKIVVDTAGKVLKSEITSEFNLWYDETYGRDARGKPSIKQVHAYMDKRFGKYDIKKSWAGIRINYKISGNNSEDDDDDEEEDISGKDL